MTHQDHIAATAARAAGRRIVHDPEAAGKVQRTSELCPLVESEIKAALRKAGCGIIRRRVAELTVPAKPPSLPLLAAPEEPPPLPPRLTKEPRLRDLLRYVSDQTQIGVMDLVSPRRAGPVVRARMIFYALAKQLTPHSINSIGKACGGRDHSTVLHGIGCTVSDPERFEPELSRLFEALRPIDEVGP